MPGWTKAEFEADRQRYEAERQRLLDSGFSAEHPLVRRQTRRIEAVERVLSGPLQGLMEG